MPIQLHPKRWFVLVFMLSMWGCSPAPKSGWAGYAEADYVYVASSAAGRLQRVAVQAGDQVQIGAVLFELDTEQEQAARAEATARLDAARAQASNLSKGRRTDEIAVTEAQLAQAQANAQLGRTELVRQKRLAAQGFVTPTQLDQAQTALNLAEAKVAELTSALRVAQLPARADEQAATQANVNAAQEVLRQRLWGEAQKIQTAPVNALVSDVFFQPGEFVNVGQAVLALLPEGKIKARFYVPEAELAQVRLGQGVRIHCDGCGAPISARISHIANQAEYTPPVIYSNAQRSKMVFLVEAQPRGAQASRLHPGQPLDVYLDAPNTPTGPAPP